MQPAGRNVGAAFAAVGGLVVVSAAVYIVARAVYVPLTYDEAASFARSAGAGPAALFDFNTATNHFLNSVLAHLSAAAFGSAEWALRLPNVLAGFAYLVSAVALARRAHHPAIGVAGLVLLATNPYLLEYLALNRGYGIAIALFTGGTCFLVRWCEPPSLAAASRRDLAVSLGLAGSAVAANFTVLPGFLALVAVAVARLAWTARRRPDDGAAAATGPGPMWSWKLVAGWTIATVAFNAMVFSRERVFDPDGFAPVTVKVAGLFDEELASIRVFRADATGRLREFTRRAGGVWTSGPVNDAWQLRIVLPAAVDRNLASLDVTMGAAVFRRDRRAPGPWLVEDLGSDRVLVSTEAIEWRGDPAHRRLVAAHAAVTIGALLAFGAGLLVLSRASIRARLAGAEEARIVAGAVLAVASVAMAPLYLLQRDGQLFFGGTSGLLADTFGSLVAGTAYGAEYHPAQAGFAVVVLAAAAVVLPLVLLFGSRARRDGGFRPAAAVLGVLALVIVQAVLQHHLFGTPYPIARTALFLLPLGLVVLMLCADAIATLGRAARVVVTTGMLLLAAGSVWNGTRAANLSRTLDWPADSSTPEMLRLVAESVAAESEARGLVRVGVEWMFYPVVRYYAERQSSGPTRYEVIVLPGDGLPFDFVYVPGSSDAAHGVVMRRFPESDAVLWRARP